MLFNFELDIDFMKSSVTGESFENAYCINLVKFLFETMFGRKFLYPLSHILLIVQMNITVKVCSLFVSMQNKCNK